MSDNWKVKIKKTTKNGITWNGDQKAKNHKRKEFQCSCCAITFHVTLPEEELPGKTTFYRKVMITERQKVSRTTNETS